MAKLNIDGHKLNYHPGRVAAWVGGEEIYPIYVEIGTTSACNHRCIFCALDYTRYRAHSLDTQILLNALVDMAKNGVRSIMFSGEGEPTLHKDFPLIVRHAKKNGLDIALTTNGIPFTKKVAELCLPYLSWVKFSIDAGTQETHAKIHGTSIKDFEKLITNIKDAVEIKKKNNYPLKIGTQALLIKENSGEIALLTKKVKELGADYIVIKPYSQHPDSLHKFDIDYEEFINMKKQLEGLGSEKFRVIFRLETIKKLKTHKNYAKCYGLPFYALIDSQGNVIPCNLFHDKEDYYYGNLYKNTFSEIWNSERRKQILEKLCKKGTASCRENCRLDYINQYLHSLKNPPEHVNFI